MDKLVYNATKLPHLYLKGSGLSSGSAYATMAPPFGAGTQFAWTRSDKTLSFAGFMQ